MVRDDTGSLPGLKERHVHMVKAGAAHSSGWAWAEQGQGTQGHCQWPLPSEGCPTGILPSACQRHPLIPVTAKECDPLPHIPMCSSQRSHSTRDQLLLQGSEPSPTSSVHGPSACQPCQGSSSSRSWRGRKSLPCPQPPPGARLGPRSPQPALPPVPLRLQDSPLLRRHTSAAGQIPLWYSFMETQPCTVAASTRPRQRWEQWQTRGAGRPEIFIVWPPEEVANPQQESPAIQDKPCPFPPNGLLATRPASV